MSASTVKGVPSLPTRRVPQHRTASKGTSIICGCGDVPTPTRISPSSPPFSSRDGAYVATRYHANPCENTGYPQMFAPSVKYLAEQMMLLRDRCKAHGNASPGRTRYYRRNDMKAVWLLGVAVIKECYDISLNLLQRWYINKPFKSTGRQLGGKTLNTSARNRM